MERQKISKHLGFQILLFSTKIRVNYIFSVDGDTKDSIEPEKYTSRTPEQNHPHPPS